MNINGIIHYFDLQSGRRGTGQGYSAGQELRVLPQYIALVLGIAVQPFLAQFQITHEWIVDVHQWLSWSLFAVITGLLIFPGVYKSAFDPTKPQFVQFCGIFAAGVGWKSLLTAAAKAGLGT